MDIKKFTLTNRMLAVFFAMIIGVLFALGLYMPALVLMVIMLLISNSLRSKVKGVVADERDAVITGMASRAAVAVYCWIAVILTVSLYSLARFSPYFEPIGATLSFSALAIMAMQSLAAHFPGIFKIPKKARLVAAVLVAAIAFSAVAYIKLSSVGYWNCENGQWTKHNEPEVPAPTMPCPLPKESGS